ncbi:MAG: ribosomal protein S18-alanine N-acetyltransferase [Candidatus Jordarchaeaceae archaeon]
MSVGVSMGNEVVIGKAELKDLDILYEIEKESFPDNSFPKSFLKYLIIRPNSVFLNAKINDEIVGFIVGILQQTQSIARIYSLDVKPEFRRRKIASKLIQTLEGEFKRRGVKLSILEVEVNNTAALNLYKKFGYKMRGVIKDYYGKKRDGFEMVKKLV